ncbi:hypothetical protein E8E78_28140 [Pseudomonas sp. BN505]|nr:hypothetical protein [Pseudomonas sp. BN605]MDH4860418.1 hypothetical protein [Pseudomonas sp. BN505]
MLLWVYCPANGRAFLFFVHMRSACALCRSGLVSRKGCKAAPAICAAVQKSWGRFAPLSRHNAAPTKTAFAVTPTFLMVELIRRNPLRSRP